MMRLEETEFVHVTIDGLGSPYGSDIGKVRQFIDTVIAEMNMTPMCPPIARRLEPREGHDDSGIKAIQPIMESHLSIHTFPEADGMVLIDLFSCKGFDARRLIVLSGDFWAFKHMEINAVDRQRILDRYLARQVAY